VKWLVALSILFLAPPASAISVDTVAVGNPGNACDTQTQGCFGAVSYTYQIGRFEVSNAQYAAFLNAVAGADPNGLYNTAMGGSQITRSGSSPNLTYAAVAGNENKPITSFSFYDALRFANWLHNKQPSGAQNASTTEDGAYTFSGPTTVGARNASARVALPTENEWYKAAYYNGTVYFDYPAGSNTATTCAMPTATPNSANCNGANFSNLTDGGSYTGSPSPYGTFDQGGNVWEWNETILGSNRVVRGGAAHISASFFAASFQTSNTPTNEDNFVGFRIVAFPSADIEFATVGNPGNVCDPQTQGCFGAVAYQYEIGRYEITNAQYAAFLNAIAASDPTGLYNMDMGFGQITRSGSSGSFSYIAVAGNENKPITSFSFYDALRFANWLHNGKPTGAQNATTTEDGSYTFSGPTTVGARNAGAKFALATENEWYKAAYFNPLSGGYFDYPAGSDTVTTCSTPTATSNHANCNNVVGSPLNVGSYTGSPSPYGTFDQGGNVWEWNETIVGAGRGIRGGAEHIAASFMAAATQQSSTPTAEENLVGFRVVPEPGVLMQLGAGVAALLVLTRKPAPCACSRRRGRRSVHRSRILRLGSRAYRASVVFMAGTYGARLPRRADF
jgi:formylglycine-generating enzyme required for sulfatase activity